MTGTTPPVVVAVCRDSRHRFSKSAADQITLVEGLGVEGDAHAGVTVRHRSRVAADPTQPNLRQVHLIHAELHDELREQGFTVEAGIVLRGGPVKAGDPVQVDLPEQPHLPLERV